MTQALRTNWIVLTCTAFVLVNLVFMANEIFWLNLLPAALLIIWAMFTAVDKLLIVIAFATPLSINLEELDIGGIGISLPTEPMMVGLMVLFLLKIGLERNVIDARVWRHPITWVVVAQLVWMLFCVIPSSMPMVSLKYFSRSSADIVMKKKRGPMINQPELTVPHQHIGVPCGPVYIADKGTKPDYGGG